jgi:hypothetical protein
MFLKNTFMRLAALLSERSWSGFQGPASIAGPDAWLTISLYGFAMRPTHARCVLIIPIGDIGFSISIGKHVRKTLPAYSPRDERKIPRSYF